MTLLQFKARAPLDVAELIDDTLAKMGFPAGEFRDDYRKLVLRFVRLTSEPLLIEVESPSWLHTLTPEQQAEFQGYSQRLADAVAKERQKSVFAVACKAAYAVAEARRQVREMGLPVVDLPDDDRPAG